MAKKKQSKQLEQSSVSANGKAKGLPPTPPPDESETKQLVGDYEPPVANKAKTNKKSVSKKQKKKKSGGLLSGLFAAFTLKRAFIAYILYVVVICSEKSAEELEDSPLNQHVCTNGLSRYILKHDLFSRYVEPSILFVKVQYNEHARPHVEQALVQYDNQVKPHVDKAVDTVKVYTEPYVETANGYAQEYYGRVKGYYDENAREHVDKYYSQASEAATPYVIMARDHASNAYEKAQEYHEKQVLPWYKGTLLPWVQRTSVRAVAYFHSDVVPAARKAWIKTGEAYNAYVVPQYKKHIDPHVKKYVEPYYKTYIVSNYEKYVEPNYSYYVQPYVIRFTEWLKVQVLGKEELERRAREDEEKKQAERKRKEAEAARIATEAFRKNTEVTIKEYRNAVRVAINAFDTAIRKPVKAALDKANSEIDKLKAFTEGEAEKVKSLINEITADNNMTAAEKTAVLAQRTKESLKKIKDEALSARTAIEKASTTVSSAVGDSKNAIEKDVSKHLAAAKKVLTQSTGQFPNADQSAVQSFIRQIDEIRSSTDDQIQRIYNGDSADIAQALNLHIENVRNVARDAGQAIQDAVASFKAQLKASEAEKASSAASDPVLDLLMMRYKEQDDPVLKKLMAGYERYKEGLPVEEPGFDDGYEDEDDGDDEDYGERCDSPGEC